MAISSEWLKKQYNDIKGNAKWALLLVIWPVVLWSAKRLVELIPHIPVLTVYAVLFMMSATAFVFLAKSGTRTTQQPGGQSVASVNSLVGQVGPANFSAAQFFTAAYPSTLQRETENNVRTAAMQTQPNDREGFYVKFIAIGIAQYVYDMIWAYIFRSQLLALQHLNIQRLIPAEQMRPFYDKAATDFPAVYANYSFDQWLGFLHAQGLILRHPNATVEITLRGIDFLKYLIHWGRVFEQRQF